MKPEAIVFDFDGVLTRGGEGLKREAWDLLVAPWAIQLQNKLYRARQVFADGRGSRFDILRTTFTADQSIPAANLDALVATYAAAYNTLVQGMILVSGMSEGTVETLEELGAKSVLYINSATPEAAVVESVRALGIERFFTGGIYGQPRSKLNNLKRAVDGHRTPCRPNEMVFIGDGKSDLKAAHEFGCCFVGIANEWNRWKVGKEPFTVVAHFRDIPAAILRL